MKLLNLTIQKITPQDQGSRAKATARLEQLTMPHWALGRLMDLAQDLAGMTASMNPPVACKRMVVMAGDHGIAAAGVSAYPPEVTPQMVLNFIHGGAGINALAAQAGAEVAVVDMGVNFDFTPMNLGNALIDHKIRKGTDNMLEGPAMSREEAVQALEAGIVVANTFADTTDVFGTGDMGIGNTTPSSAIVATLCDASVAKVTGRGTGVDDDGLSRKVEAIERALKVNQPDAQDGIDVLAKVGGFEIGGIAGLILGAAALKKPVVVDGFISTAGALIARSIAPTCVEYMIASHKSVEHGHAIALQKLGKEPYLDLGFRLGEGTGAALTMNIVDAAARVLTEVATFEEAAVSGKE